MLFRKSRYFDQCSWSLCSPTQVKCDANKAGCARCAEKRLPCIFSESRVGKVVGKRRKRPLDEAVGQVNSEAWVVNNYFPSPSMPSPATTNTSDGHSKRSCTNSSWASFIADDHTAPTWDIPDEQYQQPFDMEQARCFSLSNEQYMGSLSGLPTPALSPPQISYLSPMALETRPASRQSSIMINTNMLRPASAAPMQRTPEPQAPEDEEMVCIKLLAHIKKQSQVQQTPDSAISLLRKVNAALKRIIASKTARSDYSCQLLLTSILNSLVAHCERTSRLHLAARTTPQNCAFQPSSEYFNANFPPQQSQSDVAEAAILSELIHTVSNIAATLADSLKRKPLNGFQTLGRHESLMLTLGQRLKVTLAALQ